MKPTQEKQPVPARTVLICLTALAMFTQAQVFSYLKYDARAALRQELSEELARMEKAMRPGMPAPRLQQNSWEKL